MNKIVIIGAGGFGREVQWLIERINEQAQEKSGQPIWEIVGYIDDGVQIGTVINGHSVIGTVDDLANMQEITAVTCAIGSSKTRKKVIGKLLDNKNLIFPNLIDPAVKMSGSVEMGQGNIICCDTILTVNITLDDFCIFNLDCTVGHDAQIGSYVTAYPSVNVSGAVTVGCETELGTGAQIIQGINITKETIIGAGTVVVSDITEPGTYVGVPAKKIK